MTYYTYEVKYTDSREGYMVTVEVTARSKSDALDEAMNDYYFGTLISCEYLGEAE